MDSTIDSCPWIHVLLRGEQKLACDSGPNKTIAEDEYVQTFAEQSLVAITVCPLRFEFSNIDKLKGMLVASLNDDETELGIVLTSPRVVEAVSRALSELDLESRKLVKLKLESANMIFAVGNKTAIDWEQRTGLLVDKDASQSGDGARLAQYILNARCANLIKPLRLIYPRGSLASQTIVDTLTGARPKLAIDALLVYETIVIENVGDFIVEKLEETFPLLAGGEKLARLCLNLIFFSPSGVKAFKSDLARFKTMLATRRRRCDDWPAISFAHSSIGRTTERALEAHGLEVFCVAEEPNARSLCHCIVEKLSKINR